MEPPLVGYLVFLALLENKLKLKITTIFMQH